MWQTGVSLFYNRTAVQYYDGRWSNSEDYRDVDRRWLHTMGIARKYARHLHTSDWRRKKETFSNRVGTTYPP